MPVFAPAGTGRPASRVAVPPVTAARIPAWTGPSAAAKGSGVGAGAGSAVHGASGAPTARPSRGVTRAPVATAAVHRAFCNGVTCSSPCPMPRMIVDPAYQELPFARTESGVPR